MDLHTKLDQYSRQIQHTGAFKFAWGTHDLATFDALSPGRGPLVAAWMTGSGQLTYQCALNAEAQVAQVRANQQKAQQVSTGWYHPVLDLQSSVDVSLHALTLPLMCTALPYTPASPTISSAWPYDAPDSSATLQVLELPLAHMSLHVNAMATLMHACLRKHHGTLPGVSIIQPAGGLS